MAATSCAGSGARARAGHSGGCCGAMPRGCRRHAASCTAASCCRQSAAVARIQRNGRSVQREEGEEAKNKGVSNTLSSTLSTHLAAFADAVLKRRLILNESLGLTWKGREENEVREGNGERPGTHVSTRAGSTSVAASAIVTSAIQHRTSCIDRARGQGVWGDQS